MSIRLRPERMNEEFVKRLNSFLMAGFSYFAIDNMTIPLQGEEFCQAVTAPSYIPRILGKSEIKELPNTWTISANGNNLRVIADMTQADPDVRARCEDGAA